MINFRDIVGERVRMTTYTTNEDKTVTRKRYWVDSDGTEEVISVETLQDEEVYNSLQKTFNE